MKNKILNKSTIVSVVIVFILSLIPALVKAEGAIPSHEVPKVMQNQLYTFPERITIQITAPGIGNDKNACKNVIRESLQYSAYNLSNVSKYYTRTRKINNDVMEISLRMEYKFTRNQNDATIAFAKNWVAANIGKDMTQEQKIRTIFNFVRKSYTYDAGNPSPILLLDQGTGNCTALSGLVEILAREAGIDSLFVFAKTPHHGWNLVKLTTTGITLMRLTPCITNMYLPTTSFLME